MKITISERLSEHKYKTPEGYLICTDAILARTGKQEYRRSELFGVDCVDADSMVSVNRTEEEVFSDATLASFENKPITVEHPDEDVNSNNYKDYAVGFVRDVRRGTFEGQPVVIGNLVITDAQTIEEIENGEHTDLSCGYNCDILDEDNPQQRNIRGNHVALCKEGRAGIARIIDSTINDKALIEGRTYVTASGAKLTIKKLECSYSDYSGDANIIIYYDFTSASGTKQGSSRCSANDFFKMMTNKAMTGDSIVEDKLVGNGEVHFLYRGSKIESNVWNKNNKRISELMSIAKKYGCKIEPMNSSWSDVWLIGRVGKEEELCKAWHEINPNYSVNQLMSLHDSTVEDSFWSKNMKSFKAGEEVDLKDYGRSKILGFWYKNQLDDKDHMFSDFDGIRILTGSGRLLDINRFQLVAQLRDAAIKDDKFKPGQIVKWDGMKVKVIRKLTEQEKKNRAYAANPNAGDYYEVEKYSTELGKSTYIVWENRLRDSINDSKSDVIAKLKAASIPLGEKFEYTDSGITVQIQHTGKEEYADISKYKHNQPKVTSYAWGRIWQDGKIIFNEHDAITVIKEKMIARLQMIKDAMKRIKYGSAQGKVISTTYEVYGEAQDYIKEVRTLSEARALVRELKRQDKEEGISDEYFIEKVESTDTEEYHTEIWHDSNDEIRNVKGHYEIYVDGKFISSADTYDEAVKDLENYKAKSTQTKLSKWKVFYVNSADKSSTIVVKASTKHEAIEKVRRQLGKELYHIADIVKLNDSITNVTKLVKLVKSIKK